MTTPLTETVELADELAELLADSKWPNGRPRLLFTSMLQRKLLDNAEVIIAALRSPVPVRDEVLRNAVLDEANRMALAHSNYGHVEGNKRAFKISDAIESLKTVVSEQGLSGEQEKDTHHDQ